MKALLRKLRPLWAPFVQLVSDTSRPLNNFTTDEMPHILKVEILRMGIDDWLKKYNPAGANTVNSLAEKDKI